MLVDLGLFPVHGVANLFQRQNYKKPQAHDSPQTIVNISKKSISLRILSSKCAPINNYFIRDVTRVKTTLVHDNKANLFLHRNKAKSENLESHFAPQ